MKSNFTLPLKLPTFFLVCFFAFTTNSYSQDAFDGDYCPGPSQANPEYTTGTVFHEVLNPNPNSTCKIGTIHAKVNTTTQVLRLGMDIGNGGNALFRIYLDTDNNPLTGLTSDHMGGTITVAGAEYILEIKSNGTGFTVYTGSGGTKTQIVPPALLAAESGTICGASGAFLEFNIPFGSLGINICDVNNPGIINITKLASVSGGDDNSSICIDIPLTFGIPLKGLVGPDATICSGTNTILNLTGLASGSTVTKWQSAVSPFTTWVDIPATAGLMTYTTENLTETTKFRALFTNPGLCGGTNIATNVATITVNPAPTMTSDNSKTICSGATVGLALTSSIPSSFSWVATDNPNVTGESITTQSSATITDELVNTTATVQTVTYSVTPTATTGTCLGTAQTVTITVNPAPTMISANSKTICSGAAVGLALTSSVPSSFSWVATDNANVTGESTVAQATTTITDVLVNITAVAQTVTYIVTPTATTGSCLGIAQTVTITVNPLPTATIAGDIAVCKGAADPLVTFTGAGGTAPYTFTYNINGGANTTVTTSVGSSVTVAAPTTTAGTFDYNLVSVVDASGTLCSQAQTGKATITVNPLPTATIAGDIAVCKGAADPLVTFTGAGGTAPYTFTYNINGGANTTVTTSVGSSVTVAAPTTTAGTFDYNLVSVVDASGTLCSQAQTGKATITVNPLPTATIAGDIAVCKGAADPLVTFTGAGGTAPYTFTYNINGGANTTVTTSVGSSVTVAAPTTTAGTFDYNLVSVVDASGTLCSQAQTGKATITVNPLPTATIAGDIAVCKGAADPLVTFTGAGGTAPYTFTYNINGGANTTVTTSVGSSVTVAAPTTTAGTFDYNLVSVVDASGTLCSQAQTGKATITVNPLPTATIAGDIAVCKGAADPLVTFTGAGGTTPYTFTYNINGGANTTITTSVGSSVTVAAPTTTAGTFDYNLVSVVDASGTLCSQAQTGKATITVNPLPTATIAGDIAVCKGAADPLVTFTGAGGTAPYTFTYNINGGANTTVTTSVGSSVTVAAPTTTAGTFDYNLVSVVDASGTLCSQAQTGKATITVNPLPTATIAGNIEVCKDATAPLVTFTGSAGTAPYTFTYNIDGGANTTVTTTVGNTVTIAAPTTTAGTFVYNLVSVVDASGTLCSQAQTGTATITVNPLPVCSIAGSDGPLCPSSTANVYNAPAGMSSYAWSVSGNATINGSASSQSVSITTGVSCGLSFTLNLTIIDRNGCESTCIKEIMVQDITLPTFTKPADITIYTDASCNYDTSLIITGDVTDENDNCTSGLQATYTDVTSAGTCEGSHIITRTWSLVDACGNKAPDQIQTITIQDNTAPIITKPAANLIVECDGNGNNTALTNWLTSHGGATATDNCSQVTWTNNFDKIDADCSAAVTVEFTATDACGNKTITSATFAIEDSIAPTWSTDAGTLNATIECSDAAALTMAQGKFPVAADNCDGDLSNIIKTTGAFVASEACGNAGTYTNTWTVKDDCGNTSETFTQVITIQDTTVPTWTTLAGTLDVTIECSDADALTTAQGKVPVASDNCDADVTNITKISGAFVASEACGNAGTYTNTWTVKDDCGNTSETFTQVITIQDTTVPTWTTGVGTLDVTIECSDADALTTAQGKVPVASDNCDADVTNITKISGAFAASEACGNAGTYTNTWTVKDDCGNTSETFTQVITIQDTTVPTWTTGVGTLDVTIECSDADALATAQGKVPVASDNCDGDVTNITKTSGAFVASEACGNAGTYTNTWTVKDDCGNTSETFTQVITIQDTTVPTWTTGAGTLDVTIECSDADALATAQGKVPVASDNCDGDVTNITKTSGAFVAAEACGNAGTYTNTWTVKDDCGNTSESFTQVITIQDTTVPTWTTTAGTLNVTLQCSDAEALATAQGKAPVASDNCDAEVTLTKTSGVFVASESCSNTGTYTNTWIATDNCGNATAVFTQVITIEDTTKPTFNGELPVDLTVSCDKVPQPATITATDNCNTDVPVVYTETKTNIQNECATNYTLTRKWTTSDCGSNTTTYTQVITVKDTTAPTGTAPADITLQNIADIPVADPKAVLNATDNCSATVTVTVSDTNNGGTGCESSPYILTRTYTLSDCAGNKTLLVQTITVKHDNEVTAAISSQACNGDPSTVNLFNILPRSTTTTGTWIDTNNSNALNGSTVTSFGLAVGTYSFEYQIKDEACPRSLFVNLVVNDDCVVLACGNILVHNAFSPNGDNRNDKFVIDNIDQTACYPENTVEIYNRWGVLVFETKDYNNTTNAFDGFSRGRTTISAPSGLPAGTYFYILNYTAVDGNGAIQTHKKDGYLYLSR